jgi:hypothetical protein
LCDRQARAGAPQARRRALHRLCVTGAAGSCEKTSGMAATGSAGAKRGAAQGCRGRRTQLEATQPARRNGSASSRPTPAARGAAAVETGRQVVLNDPSPHDRTSTRRRCATRPVRDALAARHIFQHREGGPTRRPRERKTGGRRARRVRAQASAAAARVYAHQSDPDSPARRARTRPPYAAMSAAASAAKQTQNWAEGRSGPCHIDFADRASSLGRGAGRDGGGVSTHAAALDGRRGVQQHPPVLQTGPHGRQNHS